MRWVGCGDNGGHNIHYYLVCQDSMVTQVSGDSEPRLRPSEPESAESHRQWSQSPPAPGPEWTLSYHRDMAETICYLDWAHMEGGLWGGWWPGWGWRWWASPPSSSLCRGRCQARTPGRRVSSRGRGGGRGTTSAMTSLSTSRRTTSTPRWSETYYQSQLFRRGGTELNISWSDQRQQEPRPFCLLSVPDFLNDVLGPSRAYRRLVQFELDWGLAETEKTNVDIEISQTLPISRFSFWRIEYLKSDFSILLAMTVNIFQGTCYQSISKDSDINKTGFGQFIIQEDK